MKSKVHPTYKTKYRVANWAAYNRRCCMKTLRGWGGVARTSRDPPQAPHYRNAVEGPYKTKYRVANWPAYNQALVRRGDVTVWVSSEAIAAWTPGPNGRRGGQRRYSDLAIETALTLRLLYHLPLRRCSKRAWCTTPRPGRRVPARPVRDDAPRPVRLEFPILSLHPGLRQRCVAPDVGPTLSRA